MLGNRQENVLLFFETGEHLEGRMSGEESTLESEINGLIIMKRRLNYFEVDSNIEEFRWMSFIFKIAKSTLEKNGEWEDEIASIYLMVEGRKDETFYWGKRCKVEKLLLGIEESIEEEEGASSFLGSF